MHPYMLMHKYNISGRIYLKLFPYSWERHGGLLLSALYLFFFFYIQINHMYPLFV